MTNSPQGGDRPGPHGQPDAYGRPGPYGPYEPPPHEPGPYGRPAPGEYALPPHGQPPYGVQPPYVHPYGSPAPARKSRTGLVVVLVALCVLGVALAVLLPRMLSSQVLSRGAVERDVAAQSEQAHGVAVDLTCDDRMTVEEGASYQCTGNTADGEDVTLRLVITDEDDAAYTWEEV